MQIKKAFLLMVAGCATVGCGSANSTLLDPLYPDNAGSELAAVEKRVAAAPADTSPMAVAVSAKGDQLLGIDATSGATKWRRNYSGIRTVPFLAGNHVVFLHEDRLQLLDRTDGSVVQTIDADGMQIVGADGHASRAVAVLRHNSGIRANSRFIVFIDGAVRHDETVVQLVGAPVASHDLFVVPWQSQNVSALDYLTMNEIARLRTSKHVIANAFEHDGHIYFGNTEVGVWTANYDEAVPFFAPQAWDLPGNPPLLRDSYSPAAPPESAEHRVRRLWLPANSSQPIEALRGKVTVHLYYRALFALEEGSDTVRWARLLDAEVVGSRMIGDSLTVFGADGSIVVFDVRTGSVTASIEGNEKLRYVAVPDARPAAETSGPPSTVVEGLTAIATTPDLRLVPAQRLAVRHLGRRPDPAATASLVSICHMSRVADPIVKDACKGLSERTSGQGAIVEALKREASFLEQSPPPRADVLAQAAVKMNLRDATGPLLTRLQDPQTPSAQLVWIANAIGTLGRPNDVDALLSFFMLYRAEKPEDQFADGLRATLQAAAKLDLAKTAAALEEYEDAPDTEPTLVATIGSIQATYEAAQAPAENEQAEENAEEEATEDGAEQTPGEQPVDPATLPYQKRLELALQPVEKELKACSFKIRKPLRLLIKLNADNEATDVTAIPKEATTCVSPHVLHMELPPDPHANTKTIVHNITWHK